MSPGVQRKQLAGASQVGSLVGEHQPGQTRPEGTSADTPDLLDE